MRDLLQKYNKAQKVAKEFMQPMTDLIATWSRDVK